MFPRAVALVRGEAVAGKFAVEFHHDPVATHFGQNARGSDRVTQRITFNQRRLRLAKRRHRPAVDQHMPRRIAKRGQRLVHRPVCGLQNIDPVDFRRLDECDAKLEPVQLLEQLEEQIPFFCGQLFRVVHFAQRLWQPGLNVFGRKQVKIVTFEEIFLGDIRKGITDILKFLGLEDEIHEFDLVNTDGYFTPNMGVLNILRNPIVSKIGTLVPYKIRIKMYRKLREKDKIKPSMKEEDRKFLHDIFSDDVKKTEMLIGRKFPWKNFH